MSVLSAAASPSGTALRIGGFLADTLLLAQSFALFGLMFWVFGYTTDAAGFAIIGGAVAGVISVFSFVLFGLLSWFWGAGEFWRTFHPLNLSVALLAAALYYAFFYDKWTAVATAMVVGGALSAAAWRFLPHHPRVWIALCLGVLLIRYAMPWRYAGMIAAAVSVFVFVPWRYYNFYPDKTPQTPPIVK